MRILIIDNLAVASSRRDLYRLLAKQIGEPIHLLVPESWREQGIITYCEEEKDYNLKIYESPFIFGYRHQRIVYLKLKKIIGTVKPDIIFINSEPENFNTFHLVLTVSKYFPKIRLACATWRNIDYRNNPYPYKFGWINRLIESYTKKRIDICVVYSHTAEYMMKELAGWSVVYIPPSLNIEDFQFAPKQTSQKTDSFVVGYLGRLSYEKGVDILVKAISLTDKDIHGLIVGDGPEKENLKMLAQNLGISHRIKWNDAVGYRDIPSVLTNFDVLVLPSRNTKFWKEQFGRVLIEAMALGVPVIGSNSGDIPNVIGECGLIFKENDYEELANSIKRLTDDSDLLKTLLNRGREKVEKEYSIGMASQQMIDIFHKF
ncbi:MAG: glycosyltransferase family 4 protein [Bacteroidota bacterium]|nr:glycosyltransferase family 4 protein [Bacteroidota bacterium]